MIYLSALGAYWNEYGTSYIIWLYLIFVLDIDLTTDSSRGWAALDTTLNVPEITHDDFLMESFKQGAYLTLFVYLSQRLTSCQTLEEESALYTKLMDWCVQCKPK